MTTQELTRPPAVIHRVRIAIALFALFHCLSPALAYLAFALFPNDRWPNVKFGPIAVVPLMLTLHGLTLLLSIIAFRSTQAARFLCVTVLFVILVRLAVNIAFRLTVTPWTISPATFTWLTLYALQALPFVVAAAGAWIALVRVGSAPPWSPSQSSVSPPVPASPLQVLPVDPSAPATIPTRPTLSYAPARRDSSIPLLPICISLGVSVAFCLYALTSLANTFAPPSFGIFIYEATIPLSQLCAYGLSLGLSIASFRIHSRRDSVLAQPHSPRAPGPTSLAAALLFAGILTSLVNVAQNLSYYNSWNAQVIPITTLLTAFAIPSLVYVLGKAVSPDSSSTV